MRKQITSLASILTLVTLTTGARAQESGIENADGNSDGKVTIVEFSKYVESKLAGFDQIDAFAKKVDADGNGEISEDEFEDRFDVLQALQNAPPDESMKREKVPGSDKQGKTDAAKDDSATAAYNDLKKLVLASNWTEAAKHMTKKAQDEFCVEQIMSAKGIIRAELPMELPGLDDVIDDLEDALVKHNLTDIDIDVSDMFKLEWKMDVGDGDDDESSEQKESDNAKNKEKIEKAKKRSENARKKQESNQKKILNALDKDAKRWEIIGDVWKAKQKSPFSLSPVTGKVETEEIDGNKAVLRIKTVPLPRDDQPGVLIQVMSPPVYIQMEKIDGQWKYAGRDQRRTEKAMKEFMEKQPSLGGGGKRTDF